MSYSRDGVFRWKFSDPTLKGGELALARGLLYSEDSPTALRTSSGPPAFSLAEKFGRPVVGQQRLVLAPQPGAGSLNGYESGTATLRWRHNLAAGQTFAMESHCAMEAKPSPAKSAGKAAPRRSCSRLPTGRWP